MRDVALARLAPAILLVALAACSEPTTPASPIDDRLDRQAAALSSCPLVQNMPKDARNFFDRTHEGAAVDLVTAIKDACVAGNQANTTAKSWQLLALMETALNTQHADDLVAGSTLANKLLACTGSLCATAALPGINFAGPFGNAGLFAVRGANADDAIARGTQAFTDFQGQPNTALWGVEVDAPWPTVTGVPVVLVYGAPENSLALAELNIGSLRYDLKTYPDVAFADFQLHVGVCFGSDVNLPAVGGTQPEARMRREGVLLGEYVPGFCPAPQQASILGSFKAIARALLPSAWFAGDTKVRVIGGTPLDFSRFAPVASNVNGTLQFAQLPNANVTEGQSIGQVQVRARTGDGTAMEQVEVRLFLLNNQGVPAGAVLSGDSISLTLEQNGGVATFPDDGNVLRVGKPGGYSLCASATGDGFTFANVCTVIHAKNAN